MGRVRLQATFLLLAARRFERPACRDISSGLWWIIDALTSCFSVSSRLLFPKAFLR